MTVKHTPGPWKTWPALSLADCADHIRICAGIESVAKVVSVDHSWPQTAADARLIAAAPEMYQLIEKCYKVLHTGVWEVGETDEDVCSQINDIMCNHFGDDWRPRRDE